MGYTVPSEVCQESTVALDLYLTILLGLLTEEELENYLQHTGTLPPNGQLPYGNGNGGSGSGSGPQSVQMNPLLSLTAGGNGELANLNLGGQNGLLNLDVGKNGKLLTLDLNGQPLINLRRRADKLANVQVGGQPQNDADINVNLLTSGSSQNGGSGSGSGGSGSGSGGNGGYTDNNGHYLSYYQPICQRGFNPQHRSQAQNCHANDVNHCLAVCHSQAALQTVNGQTAEVLVCSAIEFDQSTTDTNCIYFVAPESEPCQESQLETNENCYTFFRN